jgi:hypothetical protein
MDLQSTQLLTDEYQHSSCRVEGGRPAGAESDLTAIYELIV